MRFARSRWHGGHAASSRLPSHAPHRDTCRWGTKIYRQLTLGALYKLNSNGKIAALLAGPPCRLRNLSACRVDLYRCKKSVTHCGDRHAHRLPAFSIGDVNPPCSFFSNGSDLPVADNAVLSTLTARPGFVEFQTEHGKKVTASW